MPRRKVARERVSKDSAARRSTRQAIGMGMAVGSPVHHALVERGRRPYGRR